MYPGCQLIKQVGCILRSVCIADHEMVWMLYQPAGNRNVDGCLLFVPSDDPDLHHKASSDDTFWVGVCHHLAQRTMHIRGIQTFSRWGKTSLLSSSSCCIQLRGIVTAHVAMSMPRQQFYWRPFQEIANDADIIAASCWTETPPSCLP